MAVRSAPGGLTGNFSHARRGPTWAPALVVALVYGVWILAFLGSGHDIRDLIRIGSDYIHRNHASSLIRPDPTYHYRPHKRDYDGQFYYFIAVDPANARYYLDTPAYRYTRIVYPLAARLLAVGRPSLIPYSLALLNWFAMVAGTLALAMYLKRVDLSPWPALIYGLYGGLFVALTRDLTEPLAYSLVLLAVLLLRVQRRGRVVAAGIAFALAALTRETTAIFPLIYAVAGLGARDLEQSDDTPVRGWSARLILLGLTFLPLLAYKLFLRAWLGPSDTPTDVFPDPVPFHGILTYFPWNPGRSVEVVCVVLPALICGGIGVRLLRRYPASPEVWALLANVLLFVVLLNRLSYDNYTASGRISAGVVVAALLCLPLYRRSGNGRRVWPSICAVLWIVLTPLLYVSYIILPTSGQ